MLIQLIASALTAAMTFTGIAKAGESKLYHVLPLLDYSATTGCDLRGFSHEMQSALRFLVFADSNLGNSSHDIHYALRHTRGLFWPLYDALFDKENTGADFDLPACIPPSWIEIGFDLALLHPDINLTSDAANLQKQKTLKTAAISADAFPVMSRASYIARTGCAIVPFAYNKYRIAFEWVTMRLYYEDEARDAMRDFLASLAARHPAKDGYLDQKCLIPAISRIASEFQLLDSQGRFKHTQQ